MSEAAGRLYAAREIAAALDVTERAVRRRAAREEWPCETERTNGGARHFYRVSDLPASVAVQIHKAKAAEEALADTAMAPDPEQSEKSKQLWDDLAASASHRDLEAGELRAGAVVAADELAERDRVPVRDADAAVAAEAGFGASSIQRWRKLCRGWPRHDWMAVLATRPARHGGRRGEIPDIAWRFFKGEYLRLKGPSLAMAYERTRDAAAANGWGELPSPDTFGRRLKREVPRAQVVLAREGERAAAQLYPRQRIDRTGIEPGKHVSADGVKFDSLWVDWGNGKPIQTSTGWFFADMRTGFLMAYRLAPTETMTLFRLATYDLVTKWGIPDEIQVDSTRAASSKTMTGRAQNRYRFGNKPGDPEGLLVSLKIEPRFTKPPGIYNQPGAKLVERSFGRGGIHERVRQHPQLEGRGTKKENAIPAEEFRDVVELCVREHNGKPGRRGQSCEGRSLERAFLDESRTVVRRVAAPGQAGLLLLAVKKVRAGKGRGEIAIQLPARGEKGRHRYWTRALSDWAGKDVYVYYDPADMSEPVTVRDANNRRICMAPHIANTAFNSTADAQEYGTEQARWHKANKTALAAQDRMGKLERQRLLPKPAEAPEIPEPGVIAPNFGQQLSVADGEVVGGESAGAGAAGPDGGQGRKFEGVFQKAMKGMRQKLVAELGGATDEHG